MRQAGRYLPQYLEFMKDKDFFAVCRTVDFCTTITLQPIDEFDGLLDAAIIFSDILVIPQAMGMTVEMHKHTGPHFPDPLKTPEDVARCLLPAEAVDVKTSLGYVFAALTSIRHALKGRVPLIGFSGAPWTLMAYMIEGGGSKLFSNSKKWLFKYPAESHALLRRITDVIIVYLIGQVRAGAQLLQVFESWGGELGPDSFTEFSLPYLAMIAEKVKLGCQQEGLPIPPMIVFAKGSHYAIRQLAEKTIYDVISIDWTVDPAAAREMTEGVTRPRHASLPVSSTVVLQGNLDPCILFGDAETIQKAATTMMSRFGGSSQRLIANLGHGMHPSHEKEKLRVYLQAIHDFAGKKRNRDDAKI